MKSHDRTIIQNDRAPAPIGPYSQGVRQGQLLFLSGQLGLDPKTSELVGPDIASQTRQVMKNIQAILEVAGSSLPRVLKTTVFMTDLKEFAEMNKVYGESFMSDPPARSTVQVSALPKGGKIEIEVIASIPDTSAAGGGLMG